MEFNDSIIMNWEECGRSWSWSRLTYYLYNYLQILKKAARHVSQDSRCSSKIRALHFPYTSQNHYLLDQLAKPPAIKSNTEWFLISLLVNFETHGNVFVKVFLMFQFTMACRNLQIMNPNSKKKKSDNYAYHQRERLC